MTQKEWLLRVALKVGAKIDFTFYGYGINAFLIGFIGSRINVFQLAVQYHAKWVE
jgi:hypothetical protein